LQKLLETNTAANPEIEKKKKKRNKKKKEKQNSPTGPTTIEKKQINHLTPLRDRMSKSL
jgi:hypothetical protein